MGSIHPRVKRPVGARLAAAAAVLAYGQDDRPATGPVVAGCALEWRRADGGAGGGGDEAAAARLVPTLVIEFDAALLKGDAVRESGAATPANHARADARESHERGRDSRQSHPANHALQPGDSRAPDSRFAMRDSRCAMRDARCAMRERTCTSPLFFFMGPRSHAPAPSLHESLQVRVNAWNASEEASALFVLANATFPADAASNFLYDNRAQWWADSAAWRHAPVAAPSGGGARGARRGGNNRTVEVALAGVLGPNDVLTGVKYAQAPWAFGSHT